MSLECVLVVDVVSGPELHRDHPRDDELGKTTPNEGGVLEHAGSLLLVEVAVLEHGGVRIEVTHTGSSPLSLVL